MNDDDLENCLTRQAQALGSGEGRLVSIEAELLALKARLAVLEAASEPTKPAESKTLRDVVANSYEPYEPTATTVTDALRACAAVLRYEADQMDILGPPHTTLRSLADRCEQESKPC